MNKRICILLLITISCQVLVGFDFTEEPDIELSEGDEELVEVKVGQLKYALWYQEQYQLIIRYAEDLQLRNESLIIENQDLKSKIKKLQTALFLIPIPSIIDLIIDLRR